MNLLEQIRTSLVNEQRLPAVKLVRQFLNSDLKTAYDLVQLGETQIGAALTETVKANRSYHEKELAKWTEKLKELEQ